MGEPAFIYVIRRGPRDHKVGLSTAPKRRLLGLQGGSRERLSIANCSPTPLEKAKEIEAFAHWILRESQKRGEWFDVTAETAWAAVTTAIEAVRNGQMAPRQIAGAGRKKQWTERILLSLAEGTTARVDAVVGEGEDRLSLIREAIDREIRRRKLAKGKAGR